MKRWHKEASMMRKRQLTHAREVLEQVESTSPLGRFRKTKVHACLRPNCHICHPGKKYGWKTIAQRVADNAMSEQLMEVQN